jgi:peptide/nickel transport system ATP-binding protein
MSTTSDERALLRVSGLKVSFAGHDGGRVQAVDGVDLEVHAGESVAVVGQSGSGKSTLVQAILGVLPGGGRIDAGSLQYRETELAGASEQVFRQVRGTRIGLVPQDLLSSLDPLMRTGRQVAEGPVAHGLVAGRRASGEFAVAALDRVGLPEPAQVARQYPSELSGGMRQRVLIAAATAARPELLIADEPTSALDVTVQKLVLDELTALVAEQAIAFLFITHDLALAAERADRVVVMYRGRIVESGPAARVLTDPQHEYTQRLVAAAPSLGSNRYAVTEEPGPVRVEVRNLTKTFRTRRGVKYAARDVSFSIPSGQTLGVVGESGSGKSTTAKALLRLIKPDSGEIRYDGADLTRLGGRELRPYRRLIQPVFQDPAASLNPGFTVAQAISEPLVVARIGTRAEQRERVRELLEAVGLDAALIDRPSARLSGGQKQRVAIARALAPRPQTLVCDEVVSALDVLVQQQILELLAQLQADLGLTYLFISHDLSVVRQIAHQVVVMRDGQIVESGPCETVLTSPQHEYTKALLAAVPHAPTAPDTSKRS